MKPTLSELMELLPLRSSLYKQANLWVCTSTGVTIIGPTHEEAVTKMLARLDIRIPTMRVVDPDYLPDEALSSLLEEHELEDIKTMSTDEAWQQYLNWHGIIGYDEQLKKAFEGIREASRWPST